MKKLIYLVIGVIVFGSCSQDDNNTEPDEKQGVLDVKAFDKFLNEKTDGAFSLTSTTTVAMQTANSAEVYGAFSEEEDLATSTNGTGQKQAYATIGGINVFDNAGLKPAYNDEADLLFGKNVEFVISKSGSLKSGHVVVDSMYVPPKLQLLTPKLDYETDVLKPGSLIEWNGDPLNEQGIVFTLVYEAYNNPEAIQAIQPNDFIRTEIVPDNGSHKLTSKLFKGVPEGACVGIIMTRGNYQFTGEETDEIYSLYAYTAIEFGVTYHK